MIMRVESSWAVTDTSCANIPAQQNKKANNMATFLQRLLFNIVLFILSIRIINSGDFPLVFLLLGIQIVHKRVLNADVTAQDPLGERDENNNGDGNQKNHPTSKDEVFGKTEDDEEAGKEASNQ